MYCLKPWGTALRSGRRASKNKALTENLQGAGLSYMRGQDLKENIVRKKNRKGVLNRVNKYGGENSVSMEKISKCMGSRGGGGNKKYSQRKTHASNRRPRQGVTDTCKANQRDGYQTGCGEMPELY